MSAETLLEAPAPTSKEVRYNDKSFELVFTNFCTQYVDRIEQIYPGNQTDAFMGLPSNASWQEMSQRLNEVDKIIEDPPSWSFDHNDEIDTKEALLSSARYLSWNAIRGALTQQYVDKLKDKIHHQKHSRHNNGGARHNLGKLFHEQDVGLSLLMAQNHAYRDYFDSELARMLGNDSPASMKRLLHKVPYLKPEHQDALVSGISLEIAAKKHLQTLARFGELPEAEVGFGSKDQDSRGGDLVVTRDGETLFIDVKSSMPKEFSDGHKATDEDYERGYYWPSNSNDEHKVVVWAYSRDPVEAGEFSLSDHRLANNLRLVASSSSA